MKIFLSEITCITAGLDTRVWHICNYSTDDLESNNLLSIGSRRGLVLNYLCRERLNPLPRNSCSLRKLDTDSRGRKLFFLK